jgi:NAD(P)-dependent dehydrogenase (short-subunit alcohol dehydrogenase family)
MFEDLKGKTALITGAGKRSGMGYAIAMRLASYGTQVVVADLGEEADSDREVRSAMVDELESIAGEVQRRYGVQAFPVSVDICSTASVSRMSERVQKQVGHVDVLCNNAGAAFGVPNTIHNYDETQWLRTFDVNLNGTFRVSKAIVPLMTGRKGSIVNTASRAGKWPPLFNGAYATAKAGVIMMTKVMAKELAGQGIRVNAICPGQIDTDLLKWQLDLESQFLGMSREERRAEMCKEIPVGSIGETRDIAALVTFLASEASRFITGQAVNITGGQLMEL